MIIICCLTFLLTRKNTAEYFKNFYRRSTQAEREEKDRYLPP